MILAAGLLVLLGLGLFVGGFLTGTTAFYWGCVVVCVVAAVLLYLARRGISRAENAAAAAPTASAAAPPSSPPATRTAETPAVVSATAVFPAAGATAAGATAAGATASGGAVAEATAPSAPPAQAEEEPARREGAHVAPASVGTGAGSVSPSQFGDPPIEDVEVTDLLLVVDLTDEVLVVDEHPRYHLAGCSFLGGRTTFPLPLDEARTDGFTPCGVCAPDRNLAERERARKRAAGR